MSKNFFSEAYRYLIQFNYDLLVFPSRHRQSQLATLISHQANSVRDFAVKTILGIEWLKFQIRELLYSIEVKETRGSGGYFMKPYLYEAVGRHKQFFNKKHEPISGESNALGIRANRLGVKAVVSGHLTEMDTRRYIRSLEEMSAIQGYKSDEVASKIFTPMVDQFNPETTQFSSAELRNYSEKTIIGLIKMLVTRSFCYQRLDKLSRLKFLRFTPWEKFLSFFREYLENNLVDDQAFEIVGHGIYNQAFDAAKSNLAAKEFRKIYRAFSDIIPDNYGLFEWSQLEIEHPSLEIN